MDVPPEIWLHIASYLSSEEVAGLLRVNQVFYDLAMTCRYQHVSLRNGSPARTKKIFARLGDPEVARRVRTLELEPHQKEYTVKLAPGPSRKTFQGILFPRYFQASLRQHGERDTLLGILPKLVRLEQLTLVLCDLPHHANIQSFLTTSWTSLGGNLQRLDVRGHVEAVRRVITSCPELPNIRELHFEFNDNPLESNVASEETALAEEIFPFVDSLRRLHSLRIFSWSRVDLARAFGTLGYFPELHTFVLRAPFNKAFQSDPSGLTRFLATHDRTLRKLDLRLNPLGLPLNPSIEEPLSAWLASESPSFRFTGLRELQLYPTNLGIGIQTMIDFAWPSAGSLTSLAIKDRYLHADELRHVLRTIQPREVEVLRINLRVLNASVVDLLVEELPKLRSLRLFIDAWRAEDFASFNGKSYPAWALRDLNVWCNGTELDLEYMQVLARAIPTVRSFWGNGDMNQSRCQAVLQGRESASSPV